MIRPYTPADYDAVSRICTLTAEGGGDATGRYVSDNEWTMAEYESQCVVWQTALNPVIALELLANGTWGGTGVLGPEAFDAVPFLDLMKLPIAEGGYGQAWGMEDRLAR